MNHQSSAPSIRIRGLRFDHGGQRGLRGADLDLHPGSVTALLGRNGAGKSTLMDACLGLLPRAQGDIEVLGLDPRRQGPALRRQIGYVEADPIFEDSERIEQVLHFSGQLLGSPDNGQTDDLVRSFGLSPRARCGSLSRGQRTSLALICALQHQPTLLLLDEPFDGLDVGLRHDILAEIIRYVDGPRSVLLSSHDLNEVERIADRVVILRDGATILQSPMEDLYTEDQRLEERFLRLTSEPMELTKC